jgi:hypothetical protein
MSESKRATPPAELERLFMDPTRPKSEAEHWAVREIEKHKAEVERLRWALSDMLSGWRYIRETYGDLTGIGWDRAEQKARNALGGKP